MNYVAEQRGTVEGQAIGGLLGCPELDEGVVAYSIWTNPSTDDRVAFCLCVYLHLFESGIEHVHQLLGSDVGRQVTQVELPVRLGSHKLLLSLHPVQLIHLLRVVRHVALVTFRRTVESKSSKLMLKVRCVEPALSPLVPAIVPLSFIPVISAILPPSHIVSI